jgi:Ca2+/Na+ antiporter
MIESVLVVLVGIFLIWIVRESKKKHANGAKLSSKEREELKLNVNLRPKKYFVVGGSFTAVPLWIVILVVASLVGALALGIKSIT